jgi:hypothetical protein
MLTLISLTQHDQEDSFLNHQQATFQKNSPMVKFIASEIPDGLNAEGDLLL